MAVEIRRVETRSDLKKFVRFPETLYADNPNWVPTPVLDDLRTLNRDKNAAFEFCEAEYWTAWKDGRMVGRIAGIIQRRAIEKWGKNYARFGWIDFIDDPEVAAALLKTVEDWARTKGLEGLHGPLGFTDLDREGLLVEGFDKLGTMAAQYNGPWYGPCLEKAGYVKDVDWLEYLLSVPPSIPEKVLRVNERISARSGLRVYPWKSRKELATRFGRPLFHLVDEAYSKLYGTTPLSEKQVKAYIDQYLGFVDPRFCTVLVDKDDNFVGFAVGIPSLSKALNKSKGRLLPFGWLRLLLALRKPSRVDMLLVAVKPELQKLGAVALIMTDLTKSVIEHNIICVESNPELEYNLAVQQLWKDYPREQHKRRRVYLKLL